MRRGMGKKLSLKVRHRALRLIYLNDYLASLLGATFADKIYVNGFNAIIENSLPNISGLNRHMSLGDPVAMLN